MATMVRSMALEGIEKLFFREQNRDKSLKSP